MKRGFHYENMTVITEDGYLLKVFRLINRNKRKRGYPILILNGLTMDSTEFLSTSNGYFFEEQNEYVEYENGLSSQLKIQCTPGKYPVNAGRNTVFTLAACGYDVWLINVRDSSLYASHTKLSDKDGKCWHVFKV